MNLVEMYASLINKGIKSIDDVPEPLRDEVELEANKNKESEDE